MKRHRQALLKAGTALLLLLPLAGCWSAVELNNRVFVSSLIIDRDGDGIELTIGFPLPNQLIPGQTGGSGGSSQPSAFISRTGDSLEDALQKIQGDLSRQLSFGQTQSIIIGTTYARQGIDDLLEFVVRHPYLRLNSNLFLVEGSAKEKVALSPVLIERFLLSVLNGYVRNNQVLNTTVKDLMIMRENGGDRIIPILSFKHNYTLSTKEQHPTVGTGGSGIIRNGKLITPFLTPEETSSVRSLMTQLSQYIYSVPSPSDGKKIGLYSNSIRTDIKPVMDGGEFAMHIHSVIDAGIIASDSSLDLKQTENLILIEEVIEKKSMEALGGIVAKTQRAGADVFGFAQRIEAKYPRKWASIRDHWRQYYKDKLKVNVTVQVNLKTTGSSSQAFNNQFKDNQSSEGR